MASFIFGKANEILRMTATQEATRKNKTHVLPRWKVILHNDDVNHALDVAKAIVRIVGLSMADAVTKTMQAHEEGHAILIVTHKEKAELYMEQFTSHVPPITVTIEPEA